MHAYMHTYTHPYIRSTNIDPDMRRVHVTLTSTYLHRYPYHTGTGTAHHHRQKSSPITTHHLFQLSLCATRLAHPSVSWQHPSNLPASSGLETQHRPPSFLLSPDGRTSRASYMPHTLECHQNSSYGLGRPSPNRRALSSAAPAVGPRLPDRRNTRPSYIPGPFCRNYTARPLKLLPSRSFWSLAWAIPTCHAHATRHSLQRTKHNHHLATKSPCRCR